MCSTFSELKLYAGKGLKSSVAEWLGIGCSFLRQCSSAPAASMQPSGSS